LIVKCRHFKNLLADFALFEAREKARIRAFRGDLRTSRESEEKSVQNYRAGIDSDEDKAEVRAG